VQVSRLARLPSPFEEKEWPPREEETELISRKLSQPPCRRALQGMRRCPQPSQRREVVIDRCNKVLYVAHYPMTF
jgi:hypothetical protein